MCCECQWLTFQNHVPWTFYDVQWDFKTVSSLKGLKIICWSYYLYWSILFLFNMYHFQNKMYLGIDYVYDLFILKILKHLIYMNNLRTSWYCFVLVCLSWCYPQASWRMLLYKIPPSVQSTCPVSFITTKLIFETHRW